MTELIFATNNNHKSKEINSILGIEFKIITLEEAGIDIDIEEPFDSLEENAKQKATVIHKMTGKSCFGEDTGLEVEALDGRPGVKSARYAGEGREPEENIKKVIYEMTDCKNRAARFRTIIALVFHDTLHLFEGICEGTIIATKRGTEGFGYDPLFIPHGSSKTFAEMGMNEKNIFSHRRKAVDQLIDFIREAK